MEDITERRNLEQERDRNYAFLSQIIDHIPSQITVKDVHDGRYLLVNRVAEAQFGMLARADRRQDGVRHLSRKPRRRITAEDEKALQSPEGLFMDEQAWQSQAMGRRYITSRRIGIPRFRGERATSSTSSMTSPSAGAPTKRSRISRITTR